ncbi:RNA exonuclease 5 [Aplochiton taeniatus]
MKTETGINGVIESGYRPKPPRLAVPFERLQDPLSLKELTYLLQFAALGKAYGLKQPSWCRLGHQQRITGVNVVILEGLTANHFYSHYLTFRHLRTKYTTRLSFTPSCSNLASGIFSSEVPGAESFRNQTSNELSGALWWHPVISRFGTATRGLTAYTLTIEEMIKKRFPVKNMPGFEGFVCTDSDTCVTDRSPLYGLDCEMCLTGKGNELTRVSLVDSDGRCILDELVKPQNRILNYCTRFSGITPAMLRPVTTTLRNVQTKIKAALPRDAVLVGHSLDNDLRALNLIHPHVIDTSLLYRKEFGQRFKLKVLAETVLDRKIQSEDKLGHDPTEDALAALELAQYFIKHGPREVVEGHLEELWGGNLTSDESPINESTSMPTLSNRFAEVLQGSGHSTAFIGKRADITLALSNQQWHSADREVLSSFWRKATSPSFSVLQLSSFSDKLSSSSSRLDQHHQRVCARLKEMCVVFAGPFPPSYSGRDVRKLFRCCGPVRNVRMLNATRRVHAEVQFDLLEGAELATERLNGLQLHGQQITVQRPVHESMLDLDLTLSALREDRLNSNLVYVAGLKAHSSQAHAPAKVNGTPPKAPCADLPGKVNGTVPKAAEAGWPCATSSGCSEEELKEAFGRFGTVEGVLLPPKPPGKCVRHAFIKFGSSENVEAANNVEHSDSKYLTSCALTPPHLRSWVTTVMPVKSEERSPTVPQEDGQDLGNTCNQQEERAMGKLDVRVGKLFRSLPDHTLSVVLLPGYTSSYGNLPGLCFLEIKQGSNR